MEYFQLKQDIDYVDAPIIPNVIMQIDRRNITPEHAHKIEKMTSFQMGNNDSCDFIDLLDRQLFLISDSLKAIFRMYLPKLICKVVVLVGKDGQAHQAYNLPIFKPVDCMAESSIMTRDKTKVTHLVLKQELIHNLPVFRVQHDHEMIIVVRLDAAESISRRRLRGIQMKRLEVE